MFLYCVALNNGVTIANPILLTQQTKIKEREMTGEEYWRLLKWLGLTHKRAAAIFGVSLWASASWRSGRRAVPLHIELALRSLVYDKIAGATVTAAVDRAIAEVRSTPLTEAA
jgi:hypothetical protein